MSIRERMALQLEDVHWSRHAIGDKDAACYAIGYSPVRHAQVVNALIDRADVVQAYPVLTARLRRLREARRGLRLRV